MHRRTLLSLAPAALAAGQPAAPQPAKPKNYRTSPTGYSDTPVLPGQSWKVHDIARPRPAAVTPGARPGDPPSDAVVLFDGRDLSAWNHSRWKVENGYVECVGRTGDLASKTSSGRPRASRAPGSSSRPASPSSSTESSSTITRS